MPKENQSDVALNYYQVMFNIYELHSRKVRKAYAESRSGTDPDAEFQAIYSRSGTDRSIELNKFKRETKMGQDTTALKDWRKKVDEELKVLEGFAK